MRTYTPSEIMLIYSSRIDKEEKNVMALSGLFKMSAKVPDRYGYFYDTVVSEHEEQKSIKIRIPSILRSSLNHNEKYSFRGILSNQLRNNGSIELIFNVTGDIDHEKREISVAEQKKNDILKAKSEKSFKSLDAYIKDALYENKKPRLLIIYAQTSIVEKDVMTALGANAAYYAITEDRVSFGSKYELLTRIKGLKNGLHGAVAFVRGGGSGLEVFNDPDIAENLLNVNAITVSAIGHSDDRSFFDNITDKSFDTPSLFGSYLKRMVDQVLEEKTHSKATLIKDLEAVIKKPLLEKIKELEAQAKDYKERLGKKPALKWVIIKAFAVFLAGLIIGAMVFK
jgi:hypothetical protein